MTWIPPRADPEHPWTVRALLWWLARRGGASAAVRLWARAPVPFFRFLRLLRAVDRAGSPVEPALRALVMARVAEVAACRFCVDLNGARAVARGVPPAKLAALAEAADSPLFDERERHALAFAGVIAAGQEVPPALREALRRDFGDDAVVELAALASFQLMSARFNQALGVPPEGACPRP